MRFKYEGDHVKTIAVCNAANQLLVAEDPYQLDIQSRVGEPMLDGITTDCLNGCGLRHRRENVTGIRTE